MAYYGRFLEYFTNTLKEHRYPDQTILQDIEPVYRTKTLPKTQSYVRPRKNPQFGVYYRNVYCAGYSYC